MGLILTNREDTVKIGDNEYRPVTLKVVHADNYPASDLSFIDEFEFKAQALGRVMHELGCLLEDQVTIEQIDEPSGNAFETKVELLILKPIKNGRKKS